MHSAHLILVCQKCFVNRTRAVPIVVRLHVVAMLNTTRFHGIRYDKKKLCISVCTQIYIHVYVISAMNFAQSAHISRKVHVKAHFFEKKREASQMAEFADYLCMHACS